MRCRFVSINFLALSVTGMPILTGNQCTRVPNSVAPGPAFRLAEGGNVVKAATLRIPAIFRLPAIWWQRVHFRAQLRADIAEAADFLHDIGINLFEAQAEAVRFFWEPITLMRVQSTSPEVAPKAFSVSIESKRGFRFGILTRFLTANRVHFARKRSKLATDVDLRSNARMRRADIAREAQLESKADLEVS
jgi:uncharacterized protein YjiS (DUF1127 family)